MTPDFSALAGSPSLVGMTGALSELFRVPRRLPLSQWAESNITLSSEYAARASELRLYAWQRDIFDSFTDPRVEEITVCSSTQMIKTLFIQCALAYVIAEAPGPALLVQPKEPDAKAFSKERLAPMIRDCEVLHGLISASVHDGSNTLLSKDFPGGSLSLVGAIAPGNLARRSIRYAFGDEIDKYPLSAGVEGDPMTLVKERTVTFGSRRKLVRTCSPTIAGVSRIQKSYDLSDRRRPWVPCHKCGEYQVLAWTQVKWRSDVADELKPSTAYYECINPECRAQWTDVQRRAACSKTQWRADRPFVGHAGFWISHLYSPWKSISTLVSDWYDSEHDREKRKAFINTALAEPWEERGETPDHEALYARREDYPIGADAVVPRRALFLTAAVDVQDQPPRLEVEVVGWGRHRENWSVDYLVLQAHAENGQALPVTSPELWAKLDEALRHQYRHANGSLMTIMVMTIDTGSRPKPVYLFAQGHTQLAYGPTGIKLHAVRTVVPIKGMDDPLRLISRVSKEDASRKRQGVRIVGIGTHCAKQEIYDLLKHVKPIDAVADVPTPGCYHFPMYEMSYFLGITSELRVVNDDGSVEYIKRAGMRNEPLDLKVYNRAAAAIFGIDRFQESHWRQLEKQVGIGLGMGDEVPMVAETAIAALATTTTAAVAPAPQPPPAARPRSVRPIRGSF